MLAWLGLGLGLIACVACKLAKTFLDDEDAP
jgi:hypothetical protein